MSLLLIIALVWLAIGLLTAAWFVAYVVHQKPTGVTFWTVLGLTGLVVVAGPIGLGLRVADCLRHKRGLLG